MKKILFVVFQLLYTAYALAAAGYPQVEDINNVIETYAVENKNLVHVIELGESASRNHFKILVAKFSHEPTGPLKPALYVNGTHHGDEKSSTMVALNFMEYMFTHYQDSPVKELLERYDIYVQPLVNPDGYASDTRGDYQGVDLNRDYFSPASPNKSGFTRRETQLVKGFMDGLNLRAAVALHSGSKEILWPWGFTSAQPIHYDIFKEISDRAADVMSSAISSQSYFDYYTVGEFLDYAYWSQETLAFTMEVSDIKSPRLELIPVISQQSIASILSIFSDVLHLEFDNVLVNSQPPPADFAQASI